MFSIENKIALAIHKILKKKQISAKILKCHLI